MRLDETRLVSYSEWEVTIETQYSDFFRSQVTKSSIFVGPNCLEKTRWPTWVQTHFSKMSRLGQITKSEKCRCTTRSPIPFSDNLENCRLTINNTILFSKFLVAPGGVNGVARGNYLIIQSAHVSSVNKGGLDPLTPTPSGVKCYRELSRAMC